jgi:hypothetical protein
MKRTNLFLLLTLFYSAVFLNSCSDDDPVPDSPTVTAPSETVMVGADESIDITFSVSVPGGFKSASATAIGGLVAVTSQPSAGATSGSVVVSYSAGTTAGAGSVNLTVYDANDKSNTATAVVEIEEEIMVFQVSENITQDTTWKTGKTYILESRIAVEAGATLTIEPGVVVKGEAGTGSNATALLIARGATIMAEGTAEAPIIFTSIADEIEPGQIESPNLDPTLNGLWGGVIVLGNAKISAKGNVESFQIEGIPTSDQNGLYGGTDDADNSGVLKFISIRHGGANIGEGNEINGLTLGGVGSGTVIENIEIVSNQDDGIEWFGGTVEVSNVVVWNTGDDAIDTDQSWSGSVDNIVVINPGDECFELDGPEGSYQGAGHTISNATVKVQDASGLIDFDENTDVNMMNIYFMDLTYSAENMQDIEEYDLYSANTNGFASSAFEVTLPDGVALTDVFKGGSDAITTVVASGANTVGADLTQFAGWSWAAVAGAVE